MEGGNGMALYIALKIEDGVQDYAKVFSCKLYQRYQDDVDAIRIDLQEPGLAEQLEEVKQTLALLGGTL